MYTDFAGNWDPDEASDDANTAQSSACAIMYAGYPILWGSKLQTLIALSSTEMEYYSMSTATHEVIPTMELSNEIKRYGFNVGTIHPKINCKSF